MKTPNNTPHIIGLAGFSGSGKTTLICTLLPMIKARGFSVSTLKHAHHNFDIDQPMKDSYRHREMGAREVLISSKARWALTHENHDQAEPKLTELLQHMSAVDIVLVEGFKSESFPKIFLHRAAFRANLHLDDLRAFQGLVAIATDTPKSLDPKITLPILDLNDPESLLNYLLNLT